MLNVGYLFVKGYISLHFVLINEIRTFAQDFVVQISRFLLLLLLLLYLSLLYVLLCFHDLIRISQCICKVTLN